MLLPTKTKKLLSKFEEALFWDERADLKDKLYGFYKILRPAFNWLLKRLEAAQLALPEIESELYILCCNLYFGFDRTKSSIIPYLERQIPWYIKSMFYNINSARLKEIPIGLIQTEYTPKIDTLIKYIQEDNEKYFTRGQKYLIYVILTSDDNELSQNKLANKLNTDVRQLRNMLQELKQLEEIW